MPTKNFFIAIFSVTIIFIFLFIIYKIVSLPDQAVFPEINKITPSDHLKWAAEQKNILVEYSDFQCSACLSFHEYIKKEIEASKSGGLDITKKVTFIFRHFPLYQIHANAFESAYVAEAAGRQGKFYEMVDLLFEKQDDWTKNPDPKPSFAKFAKLLKLDLTKFNKDLNSKDIKDKVNQDLASGEKAGINSTPTFFFNGRKLDLGSIDEFKKLLISL